MAFGSCSLEAHRQKVNEEVNVSEYTDAEAEQHAAEVGVPPRPMETKNEIDERGAFVRQANSFIVPFGDKEGEWKSEAGRYRFFWAKGCNWSNRPIIARDLLGLQDVISDQLTSHSGESNKYGHGFGNEKDHKDPVTGAYFLSEFYKRAKPDFKGRATTPTLVDAIDKIAVNNDYHRLSNYVEVQFRKFQPVDAPDIYPKAYRREIDQFNDWLFPHVNNGHYRMAFCQSLEAYNEAFDDFYDSMDKLEERLGQNRFLFGDFVTDADIRFFVTIARWDIGYFRNVGPVKHRIVDYKNIWGYARELYEIPAFRNNTYLKDLAKGHGDKDKQLFADWNTRIAGQIDFDKLWAVDEETRAARRAVSNHPDEIFLRHPADETPEDYQSEISVSPWNRESWADRNPSDPKNSPLDLDASINPLKGKIDA